MDILEKDLEDLIFDALESGKNELIERGFEPELVMTKFPVRWYRQVNLGPFGFADIIGICRRKGGIVVDVIELKNRPIKNEDFNQVLRYTTAVTRIIHNSFRGNVPFYINPYLVGPDISDGHYIHNNSGVFLYTFKFTIKGFQFKQRHPGWTPAGGSKITLKDVSYRDSLITPSSINHQGNG